MSQEYSSSNVEEVRRLLSSDRQHGWRKFKDRLAAVTISIGGFGVLFAILLIFFYLLYEIVPLFRSATVVPGATYSISKFSDNPAPPLYLTLEEQNEVGLRIDRSGDVVFFKAASGEPIKTLTPSLPVGVSLTSFALDSDQSHILGYGLSDGSVLLLRHDYISSYGSDVRSIEPHVSYPFGETPLAVNAGAPLSHLAVRDSDSGLVVVGVADNHLVGRRWDKREDFLSGEKVLEESTLPAFSADIVPTRLLISPDQKWLYAFANDSAYRVIDLEKGQVVDSGRLFDDAEISNAQFLLGGISIMVSSNRGTVGQWFLVRRADGTPQLTHIRNFSTDSRGVNLLAAEQRRKGFAVIDADQRLQLMYSTSERTLLKQSLGNDKITAFAFSPRANAALYETEKGELHVLAVENHHPEVSWSALWNKVWYEHYGEPEYVWQSSSASSDFEPKYSLMPLAFGTLKAAFYAMIVAAPLAICGAIFTAYFMAPELRRKIKPLIELMAALPTVILGFLAGLWLAPVIERNLPGVFSFLIMMPLATLLAAFCWNVTPMSLRKYVPDGWQPLLLVPVVLGVGWLCFGSSGVIEHSLFAGDVRLWMKQEWGVDCAQRNALIVGIAMGFAVIPNIYSIAEDAIFSVPKQLSYGSLALGATPWQTLTGVVLPTASPGIFSALMIGLGRAVGETMIVLMAAGNTPIMDLNLFEGMRTLSANIAVEIGETAVNSTHYRVLFLAAFVLFMFTFVLNTLAEIIRQRLRSRYSVI
ncbi:MAG: ABC transporter permease subunit [Spongiibacteraceae bacterium]